MSTECSKCSDVQKKQSGKVLTYVLQYYRPEWDKLLAKYDPEGVYRKKYDLTDKDDEEFEYYDDDED